jgi:cyclopropane-fatty-acyl-phospholipid synthase
MSMKPTVIAGSEEDRTETPDRSSSAAAEAIRRVLGGATFGFAARLWDGSRLHVGGEGEPFTLVFRSRRSFRKLMLRPNTLRFAVAFVNGEIDVEGDLFAAVRLAAHIEALRVGLKDRLAVLRALML